MLLDGVVYPLQGLSGSIDETTHAAGIRIGKTFFAGDDRYIAGKLSCIQIYDIPMTETELRQLELKCVDFELTIHGKRRVC